jgi:apolipoprotein N-acyltransferase
MNGDVWGYTLLIASVVGFVAEVLNNWLPGERFFWLVSLCHVILFGILIAFAASATVGVVTHDSKLWASVLLAGYLGLMNFIYVQRKGSAPSNGDPR